MSDTSELGFGEIQDVKAATKGYIRKYYLGKAILLILFTIIAAAIVIFAADHFANIGILNLLIIVFAIPVIAYKYMLGRAEHEFIKQFAKDNGYSYQKAIKNIDDLPSVYLHTLGRSQSLADIVTGIYNNEPLRLYTCGTIVGEGRSSHQIQFTVFETAYAGDILDIILDSHIHPFQRPIFSSSLFTGKKKLSLEGNFDKYFTVYIPDGYEIEALEILTPDIMQELITKSNLFSFEFNHNKLFIYAAKLIASKAELDAMYDFSKTLTAQLAPSLEALKK